MKSKTKQVVIDSGYHKEVKKLSADLGVSIKEYIETLLVEYGLLTIKNNDENNKAQKR